MTVADECRAMGLSIGDTIEGCDTYGNRSRLTLLWVGDEMAVWSEMWRTSSGEWSVPRETAAWSLGYREWKWV